MYPKERSVLKVYFPPLLSYPTFNEFMMNHGNFFISIINLPPRLISGYLLQDVQHLGEDGNGGHQYRQSLVEEIITSVYKSIYCEQLAAIASM